MNGYTVHDTPYGKGVSITDLEGLHRVIGQLLLSKRRLIGAEIRFLRKELGCSQKGLAEIIGTSEQTVSLWERDRGQIPPAADRVIRLFYAERLQERRILSMCASGSPCLISHMPSASSQSITLFSADPIS